MNRGSFASLIPTCAVAMAAACLLAGCEMPRTEPVERSDVPELSYFRDDTTGLCFAGIKSKTYRNYKVVSITHVPCQTPTDEKTGGEG